MTVINAAVEVDRIHRLLVAPLWVPMGKCLYFHFTVSKTPQPSFTTLQLLIILLTNNLLLLPAMRGEEEIVERIVSETREEATTIIILLPLLLPLPRGTVEVKPSHPPLTHSFSICIKTSFLCCYRAMHA
jgi:hypothetical protein